MVDFSRLPVTNLNEAERKGRQLPDRLVMTGEASDSKRRSKIPMARLKATARCARWQRLGRHGSRSRLDRAKCWRLPAKAVRAGPDGSGPPSRTSSMSISGPKYFCHCPSAGFQESSRPRRSTKVSRTFCPWARWTCLELCGLVDRLGSFDESTVEDFSGSSFWRSSTRLCDRVRSVFLFDSTLTNRYGVTAADISSIPRRSLSQINDTSQTSSSHDTRQRS